MKPKPLESAGVVGYIRGSTEDQKNTIEAQDGSIRRYCAGQSLHLARCFSDSGVSGGSTFMERPAVLEMLAFMQAQGITQIVFTKLDRAFRSVRDCVLTLDEWASKGVAFHIIEQKIDTSNAMGRAFLQIMAVLAELENGQRSERQSAAFRVMRATGQRTGNVSYGWDAVAAADRTSKTGRAADDLVINAREYRILLQILAWSGEGKTDCAIARALNDAGIKTKNAGQALTRKGRTRLCTGKWQPATVRSIRLHARLDDSAGETAALPARSAAAALRAA